MRVVVVWGGFCNPHPVLLKAAALCELRGEAVNWFFLFLSAAPWCDQCVQQKWDTCSDV